MINGLHGIMVRFYNISTVLQGLRISEIKECKLQFACATVKKQSCQVVYSYQDITWANAKIKYQAPREGRLTLLFQVTFY